MTLTKRSDKGQALTYEELDGNFTHLGGDGSYQFPATDGLADQVLATDGNGQLYFRDQLQTLTTDVVGSVFADDSTLLIDGTEGTIVGPVETSQLRTSEQSIVLGLSAGSDGYRAIAIGRVAGNNNQGMESIAIGNLAGYQYQGNQGIAIGRSAAIQFQGENAIAIGSSAGRIAQGARSIAIGINAGTDAQHENTIIISAQDATNQLQSDGPNRFFVKPVREVTGGTPPAGFSPCYYNPTTGEFIVVTP